MDEKKDPHSIVVNIKNAATYIVDKDGNEIEQQPQRAESTAKRPLRGVEQGEKKE